VWNHEETLDFGNFYTAYKGPKILKIEKMKAKKERGFPLRR